MLFEYKNIIFDIDERNITEEETKSIFGDKISIATQESDVIIAEVNFEDKTFGCVFIEKQGVYDEWDPQTIGFVETLEKITDFSIMYADEDYGEYLDVILIHNE